MAAREMREVLDPYIPKDFAVVSADQEAGAT
jgi:hypothetical protein